MEVCQACKTIYSLEILKPGEDYNDFGIRYCPYCGNPTQGLPDFMTTKRNTAECIYILITLFGGIIDHVKYYTDHLSAINALSDFVKSMETEDEDAAVYYGGSLIANAKDFLNENDEFIENPDMYKSI
jgi:hypothetical protein